MPRRPGPGTSLRVSTASLILFLALLPSVVRARDVTGHPRMTTVTFHLQVGGAVDRRATFWVAYGPLADRFGLVRLHRSTRNRYLAHTLLPAQGTTTFTFLAGQGTIHTHAGMEPGNPVVVIARLGPTFASALSGYTVRWEAPLG